MKLKNKITPENLLLLFIILCPIFDIASYWFRNIFHTEFSIATILRPIIPAGLGLYIFAKANKKEKIFFAIIGASYVLYAIAHLLVSKNMFMDCAYGTINNEAQYVLNFTFLIIYFVIYNYIFVYRKKDHIDKSNFEKSMFIIFVKL